MKKLFVFFLVASINGNAQADLNNPIGIGITFGGSRNDRGVHIIKTSDNFLVTVGVTEIPDRGEDIFVVKTDLTGNKIWEKTFGGSKDDAGWDIEEIEQGQYILLTGWSNSYSKDGKDDIILMKISKDGDFIWHKVIEGPGIERCWSLDKLRDGHLILIGQTQDRVTRSTLGLVTKITTKGDIIWQKKYGDSNYNRLFYSTETTNEQIFIAGITRKDSLSENSGWVLLIDKNGNQVKSNQLNSLKNITSHGVLQISKNEILVLGYAQTDTTKNQRAIYLSMFDQQGNLKWEKATTEKESENHGIGAIVTSSGTVLVTGYTRPLQHRKWEGVIYNFSIDGKMIWRREFGGSESDQPYGIVEVSKESFVVTGLTKSYGSGEEDLWLVWFDNKGNVVK